MSYEVILATHSDSRGSLTVIEKNVPFDIKRVYYIYNCSEDSRGGHRHHKTVQALICVKGSCVIDWYNEKEKGVSVLNSPDLMLIVPPEDFHTMKDFSDDAILLVLASEFFDPDDYIDEVE